MAIVHSGQHQSMHSNERAELATIATSLDDLVARVTVMAKGHQGTPREDLAVRLFELERALIRANRQLAAVMRHLGS